MTATTGIDAYGTILKRNGVSIANVTNLSPPPLSREMYEATQHDGPGWDEYLPGLLRGGQVSLDIDLVLTDATHSYAAGLIKDMVDGTLQSFSLEWPDVGVTTWSFSAYVANFTPAAPTAGKLTATVILQISGQPTLA